MKRTSLLFGFLEYCNYNEIDLDELEALDGNGSNLNIGFYNEVLRRA